MSDDLITRAREALETVGWVPVADVPEAWKDGRPLAAEVRPGYLNMVFWDPGVNAWREPANLLMLRHDPLRLKDVGSPTSPDPTHALLSELLSSLVEAREALAGLHHAVCGETGFAAAVRGVSGTPYPWPALDLADEKAIRALNGGRND